MFISPYFGGCKYTNNFLFINKNIVFQHFGVLITFPARPSEIASNSPTFCLINRSRISHYPPPVISAPICHFDRTEWMEKSLLPTILQKIVRFTDGRCPKRCFKARKRHRPTLFQAFRCRTVRQKTFWRSETMNIRKTFIDLYVISYHFERDAAKDRRERTCKR